MTDEAPDEAPSRGPAAALRRARERVVDHAVEDGAYCVACARTGARPEPVTGATFATHEDAAAAAEAAREYRAALRDLDPDAGDHDLVVAATGGADLEVASARERADGTRPNGLPRTRSTATVTGGRDGEWLRLENAPVVHLARAAEPLDDEAVARQLDAKLGF